MVFSLLKGTLNVYFLEALSKHYCRECVLKILVCQLCISVNVCYIYAQLSIIFWSCLQQFHAIQDIQSIFYTEEECRNFQRIWTNLKEWSWRREGGMEVWGKVGLWVDWPKKGWSQESAHRPDPDPSPHPGQPYTGCSDLSQLFHWLQVVPRDGWGFTWSKGEILP